MTLLKKVTGREPVGGYSHTIYTKMEINVDSCLSRSILGTQARIPYLLKYVIDLLPQ